MNWNNQKYYPEEMVGKVMYGDQSQNQWPNMGYSQGYQGASAMSGLTNGAAMNQNYFDEDDFDDDYGGGTFLDASKPGTYAYNPQTGQYEQLQTGVNFQPQKRKRNNQLGYNNQNYVGANNYANPYYGNNRQPGMANYGAPQAGYNQANGDDDWGNVMGKIFQIIADSQG